MINKLLQSELKKYSLRNPLEESCGLLINKENRLNFIPAPNIAINRVKDFKISCFDYMKAENQGKIAAIFHSHPNGKSFSELDRAISVSQNLINILYDIKQDLFDIFQPKDYNNQYIGRIFNIGKADCYTLVRDYYKNELEIEILDFRRDENWQEDNINIFNDIFAKEKFIKALQYPIEDISKIDVNDILCLAPNKKDITHFAIYQGCNKILHHPRNQLSLIEEYSLPWILRTKFIIRRES